MQYLFVPNYWMNRLYGFVEITSVTLQKFEGVSMEIASF